MKQEIIYSIQKNKEVSGVVVKSVDASVLFTKEFLKTSIPDEAIFSIDIDGSETWISVMNNSHVFINNEKVTGKTILKSFDELRYDGNVLKIKSCPTHFALVEDAEFIPNFFDKKISQPSVAEIDVTAIKPIIYELPVDPNPAPADAPVSFSEETKTIKIIPLPSAQKVIPSYSIAKISFWLAASACVWFYSLHLIQKNNMPAMKMEKIAKTHVATSRVPASTPSNNAQLAQLIQEGKERLIKDCLQNYTCDANSIVNNKNQTPMMVSILSKQFLLAEYFLKNGAQVDVQDQSGSTALLYAVELGNTVLVGELLKRGANPTLKRWDGISAYSLAKQLNNPAIWNLMKDYRLE